MAFPRRPEQRNFSNAKPAVSELKHQPVLSITLTKSRYKPAVLHPNRTSNNSAPWFEPSLAFGNYLARSSSSSSSKRWQNRQGKDKFVISAKVQGLKSRAAFKLLEINEKHKIFHNGQTVVDLGYAPGSWSQVALDRTAPDGRVVGIDIIPAQPPKGVSTIQGNFLSPAVQEEVKKFLKEADLARVRPSRALDGKDADERLLEEGLDVEPTRYFESESRAEHLSGATMHPEREPASGKNGNRGKAPVVKDKMVDVVLSDMSAPWEQTDGFWKRSLSDPYYRMMNTSGMKFRDHAGSMDLCDAALRFAFDTLRAGGHFVCKFYQGGEDKALELRLRSLFAKVHREKPESSRSVR
ncbi:2' O-ribose methyltransferase [Lobaria immixta]|nr:2' O-ribose methyltransferase [Lobaria immixta]